MYKWLLAEIAQIKTNNFHIVDGPLSAENKELVQTSAIPVPPAYKEFVIQFGNAKLYRQGGGYLVKVYAVPQDAQAENGEGLLLFGRTDMGLAYFKESLLVQGDESPVFEWRGHGKLYRTAPGFEQWLQSKCAAARKTFKKKRWEQIKEGPPPFSEWEQKIVEARRKFKWSITGIASNGDIQYQVYNGSDMVLPYLSIGIRGKHGKNNGGVWLPISSVLPGQTRVIEKDSYKNVLAPEDVEAFEKPDPGPEDRDRYWEFKALS